MQDFTMEPMSAGEIIGRTFRIYRSNFSAMLLLCLLIGGVANLVVALLQLGLADTGAAIGTLVEGDNLTTIMAGNNLLASALDLAVQIFVTPLVSGGIAFIALAVSHGETDKNYFPRIMERYGNLVGTALAIAAITFLIGLGVGFFHVLLMGVFVNSYAMAVFPPVVLMILLAMVTVFAYPVAIHEDRYGFAWFGRSWGLMKCKFGKTLGIILLSGAIVYVVGWAVGAVTALLPPVVETVLDVAVTALLTPIPAIAMALLYLDIRMSTEGYDPGLRGSGMPGDDCRG